MSDADLEPAGMQDVSPNIPATKAARTQGTHTGEPCERVGTPVAAPACRG